MTKAGYIPDDLPVGKGIYAAELFLGLINDIYDGRRFVRVRHQLALHAQNTTAFDLHGLGVIDLCVGVAEVQGEAGVCLE